MFDISFFSTYGVYHDGFQSTFVNLLLVYSRVLFSDIACQIFFSANTQFLQDHTQQYMPQWFLPETIEVAGGTLAEGSNIILRHNFELASQPHSYLTMIRLEKGKGCQKAQCTLALVLAAAILDTSNCVLAKK